MKARLSGEWLVDVRVYNEFISLMVFLLGAIGVTHSISAVYMIFRCVRRMNHNFVHFLLHDMTWHDMIWHGVGWYDEARPRKVVKGMESWQFSSDWLALLLLYRERSSAYRLISQRKHRYFRSIHCTVAKSRFLLPLSSFPWATLLIYPYFSSLFSSLLYFPLLAIFYSSNLSPSTFSFYLLPLLFSQLSFLFLLLSPYSLYRHHSSNVSCLNSTPYCIESAAASSTIWDGPHTKTRARCLWHSSREISCRRSGLPNATMSEG